MNNANLNELKLNQDKFLAQSSTPLLQQRKSTTVKMFLDWANQKKILKDEIIYKLKQEIDQITNHSSNINRSSVAEVNPNLNTNRRVKLMFALTFLIFVGFGLLLVNRIYNYIFQPSVAAQTKTLYYHGRLTDALGRPIAQHAQVRFRLYSTAENGNSLYDTASRAPCSVTPDKDGEFSVIIGQECGDRISQSIFNDHSQLYLGITVADDQEMTPRQMITNVGNALQAETLQGLSPGTNITNIPYINQEGNLLITATTPGIRSLSPEANLAISSAKGLILQSANLGDIILNATDSGRLRWQIDSRDIFTIDSSGQVTIASLDLGGLVKANPSTGTLSLATPGYDYEFPLTFFNGLKRTADSIGLGGKLSADTNITLGDYDLLFSGNGNIGIATNSAKNRLDVAGNVAIGPFAGEKTAPAGGLIVHGNVGIGFSDPNWKLQVRDAQTATASALIENVASNQTDGHTGLILRLGGTNSTLNPNSSDRFINFMRGDSAIVGKIQGNGSGGVTYRTSGVDFAEYFPQNVQEIFESGDVVMINSQGKITKSNSRANPNVVGIVSSHPGFSGGNPGPDKVLVALIGQVPVKVTIINGPIKAGDLLTSADQSGLAMKATAAGPIIGRALENFTDDNSSGQIMMLINPGWSDPDLAVNTQGDVIISASSQEPYVYHGNLDLDRQSLSQFDYQLVTKTQQVIDRLTNFSKIIAASINAGYIASENMLVRNLLIAKDLSVDRLSAIQGTLDNLIVREKIASPVIESQNIIATGTAQLATVKTEEVQPIKDKLTINLDNASSTTPSGSLAQLIIKGLAGRTVTTIDNQGNASFSGQLTAEEINSQRLTTNNLSTETASVSGKLYAQEVQADNINQLSNSVSNNQQQLQQLTINNQQLSDNINGVQKILADISQQQLPDPKNYPKTITSATSPTDSESSSLENLTITGKANLFDVGVSNSLTAGNLLLEDNQILSLAWELKLSSLSTINMFDGAVVISRDGTLITRGPVVAGGGVKTDTITPLTKQETTINGNLSINGQLGLTKYLEATAPGTIIAAGDNLVKNGINLPAIETQTQTAGLATLPAYRTELIIYNQAVKQDSLIYLTQTGQALPVQLSVVEKQPCTSQLTNYSLPNKSCRPYFKIAIDNSLEVPVNFNWLIIN